MEFLARSTPEILFGAGSVASLGARAAALAPGGPALLVADARLVASGAAGAMAEGLRAHGVPAAVFAHPAAEPTAADVAAAAAAAREAGARLIVGAGGGSALDTAKVAAFCAASGADPRALADGAPAPAPLPRILIPTTAGAGAETSATCVFARPDGRKTWLWDPRAKPELVILDPALAVGLPPDLTGWTGMDAFVHAFEASTNRRSSAASRLHGHAALAAIAGALPRAVAAPTDLEARGAMAWGAALAGAAIDNAGTSVAHMLSHALAALAPAHHGRATALAFEATLPWVVARPTPALDAAAAALGLRRAADLPGFATDLMDRAGCVRALPTACAAVDPAALAAEAMGDACAPMRAASPREVTAEDARAFAGALLALAAAGAP
jgi:alcohol dehydrogenase class IV